MPNLNFRKENVLGHLITKWDNSNYRAYHFCTLVCQDHAKKLPIQALDTIVDASQDVFLRVEEVLINVKLKTDNCYVSGCQKKAEFIYHFNE